MNLSIFDMMYPKYKITKPIRLIECFAGYGSQALALKYLGVPFEHWKICEWAVKSIQAYKDIHFSSDNEDYSKGQEKEQIINWLYEKGISSNYNEPMTLEQIKRLNEKQIRTIYSNILCTNNLVNIQQVKGEYLEIFDTDKYDYIMTYSFPCQDLSLAGKKKGMSDTSTRSGMLWEVERILIECQELGTMPQILLMENVPQVHSLDNMPDFHKWQVRLEELGYKSYWQDLIATDFEIPQTRNRCFMVSILGDYSYSFPQPKPLKLKLKDMLEDNVDEKYYLSDKMLNYCLGVNQKESKFPRGERFLQSLKTTNEKGLATTINTNAGNRPVDNFIAEIDYLGTYDYAQSDTLRPTMESRTHLDSDVSGALLASGNHNGVVVNMKRQLCNELVEQGKVKENDVIRHSYTTSRTNDWEKRSVEQNNLSPTLDTRCDCLGVCVNDKPKVLGGIGEKDSNNNTQWKQQNMIYDDNVAISVTTAFNPYYKDNLRIRKLTPRECFRLMGVKDEDFDKVKKNQSDASLYHLAGDSIVVNVLMAIFKELL